jgi:hypothetical protein
LPEGSEHNLALLQADQARGDLCATNLTSVASSTLGCRERMDMVRLVPGGSALTVALIELLRVLPQP